MPRVATAVGDRVIDRATPGRSGVEMSRELAGVFSSGNHSSHLQGHLLRVKRPDLL